MLGVGVLYADPLGGLGFAGVLPAGRLLGRRAGLRLQRRGADLVGERLSQSPVPGVDLGLYLREPLEQVADAVGLQRRLVMHAARPERAGPQGGTGLVGDDGGLLGVLLLLPRDERPGPGRPGEGRRTCTSVPSIRSVTPSDAA